MKLKSYKNIALALCLMISVGIFAQKTSKKFTERFSTNKDVEVNINASNAEIDVTTWNKNEVLVEAYFEIEGISKKKAQEYLENYKFEALGNKSTVKINARSGGYHFNNDFVIFNNNSFKIPDIVIPEMPDIKIPDIVMPDLESFNIPKVDFDDVIIDFDHFDFDMDRKDGNKFTFKWDENGKEKKVVIKSKEDWEKFKKSAEYKKFKAKMKNETAKLKKELAKLKVDITKEQKKQIKESLAKAREQIKKIDKEKIRAEIASAREKIKNDFRFNFDSDNGEVTIDGKKVKIKKRIVVKVPKGATFDLNTRHCKVKLPKSKASGKVSYGTFKSIGLDNGSDLKISFSPVNINSVNQSELHLENVTDASLASVIKSRVNSISGNLKIKELGNDVILDADYGEVEIVKVVPEIRRFNFNLRQSDAVLSLLGLTEKLTFQADKIISDTNKNQTRVLSNFRVNSKDDLIKIIGRYSELLIKK